MIVYFAPGGRLGNQIFQAAFLLNHLEENERVILAKMDNFLEIFDWDYPTTTIRNKWIYKLFDRWIVPYVLSPLSKRRVFSRIGECSDRINAYRSSGFLRRVRIVEGYFQSESFFPNRLKDRLKIKDVHLAKAKSFLADFEPKKPKVCIHIRRQDYLSFFDQEGRSLALPLKYYRIAIDRIKRDVQNPAFVFVSDDPEFVKETFRDIEPRIVSSESPAVDLAIMTQCQHMVMSNSTLSWWGAYLREKPGYAYAPEYWLGWPSKWWDPPGIRPSFAQIIPAQEWSTFHA